MTTRSNRGRLRRTIAGAAVSALLFSACAADDEALVADDQAVDAADSAVFPTVSGGQIDISSLEGTDTILWFWAPW